MKILYVCYRNDHCHRMAVAVDDRSSGRLSQQNDYSHRQRRCDDRTSRVSCSASPCKLSPTVSSSMWIYSFVCSHLAD